MNINYRGQILRKGVIFINAAIKGILYQYWLICDTFPPYCKLGSKNIDSLKAPCFAKSKGHYSIGHILSRKLAGVTPKYSRKHFTK